MNNYKFILGVDLSEMKRLTDQMYENSERLCETINELREENNKLKSEHYENEVIQQQQQEIKELKQRTLFNMAKEESEKVREWTRKHDSEVHHNRQYGVSGSRYIYEFQPTGIGMFGTCTCSSCRGQAIREAGKNWYKRLEELDGMCNFMEP